MVSFILIYCLSISTFPNKHFPLTQRVGTSSRSVVRLEKSPNTLFDSTLTLMLSGTVIDSLYRSFSYLCPFYRVCCRKRRLTKASSLSQRLQQEQKSFTPKKILCLHFFSFLPHKVIVDRLTAVNKNVLTRTEFVRYRQEICPVCNFLGSRPSLERRFTHNLRPKLGIVHHTLI